MAGKFKVYRKNDKVIVMCQKNIKLNRREIEILNSGELRELITPTITTVGNKVKLFYDLTGYVPFMDAISVGIKKKDFTNIALDLPILIDKLESKYMQKNNLVLNMNYVFYNPKVKKIKYIYLPLIQIEKKDETLDFLRNLPYYVVFTRSENADYVTKYLSYFKEKINFSMYEFKELIKKISSTEKKERVQEYGNIKEKKLKFAQLLDMDTGEKIDIVSQKYVIGKNEDCDLVVNSTHISRHHAYISYVDGIYYLVDMGSTNHTYIDGEELERGIPVELHNGMQVKFADKMYKFYLTVKGAAD